MLKEVTYPRHLKRGILPLKGSMSLPENLIVMGGDTETVRGEPDTIQLVGPEDHALTYVNRENIFPEFWAWVRGRCRIGGTNLIYFHNLNFDLRVLFRLYHLKIYEQYNSIEFEALPGVHVKMLFGKVNTATITQGRIKLQILDSKAFTQASLARSLKMFKIPQEKRPKPIGLGQVSIMHLPEGPAYAMQDAFAQRALAQRIIDIHATYGIRPCITLPSFSSRVFRTHFLRLDEKIPCPPVEVMRAAELSYHGGKNGYYLKNPEVLEDLYEVDISSAYPYAMKSLPGLTKGEFAEVTKLAPKHEGIYQISGRMAPDGYPCIFDSSFKKIAHGEAFKDIWITSYELRAVMELSNAEINIERGYIWLPENTATNPFARYVDHFYNKKEQSSKDDPFYHFYKIALNGLYGKLCATQEQVSIEAKKEIQKLRDAGVKIPESFALDERFDSVIGDFVSVKKKWVAGSMYNPFWASLITGHTRAYLYRLENILGAVHSATDSVKSLTPHKKIAGLGGLKVECFGRAYLLRNKLYLHCSHDAEFCGHKEPPYKYPNEHPKAGQPLLDDDGQHLCKVGMHGFKGYVWELWEARHRLIKERGLDYEYTHVVGLREGMKRKESVCDFVKRKERLTL